MRYNWNAIIAAVGFLTDEPESTDSLTGKGFSVTRTGPGRFNLDIEQVEFPEDATPETPTPEAAATAETPEPVPADAASETVTETQTETQTETPIEKAPETSPENPGGERAQATGQVAETTEQATATGQ